MSLPPRVHPLTNTTRLGMVSKTMTVSAQEGQVRATARPPWLMLALATTGFAVNFWAWALISPLGPMFRDQ